LRQRNSVKVRDHQNKNNQFLFHCSSSIVLNSMKALRIRFHVNLFKMKIVAISTFVPSNGSALSCGADKFQVAENETSSC
jgi:hypothetical protein